MLIKESTLRRIIREEARRALREEAGDLGGITVAWPRSVEVTSSFARAFAQAAGTGGRALEFVQALKSIHAYGMKSEYARFAVAPPATVTGAPGGGAQMYGKLLCLMASMANKQAYTDYASAQTVLTGKSSNNTDVVGPMILKALGGSAGESEVLGMINQIKYLASNVPPDGVPEQAARAVDPGESTYLNQITNSNNPLHVVVGSLDYTLQPSIATMIAKNLNNVAAGKTVLRNGSVSAGVADIQRLLNAVADQTGFFEKIVVDGKYGGGTIAAVRAFQTGANITVDGTVGQQTLAQMLGLDSTVTGAAGPKGQTGSGRPGARQAGVGTANNPAQFIAQQPTQSLPESRRRRY